MSKIALHSANMTKWTCIILLLFISIISGFSQNDSIQITTNDTIKSNSMGDTTKIIIGDKEIQITEKHDEQGNKSMKMDKKWRSGGFRGHWSGFEIGLNNYLNANKEMSLSPADKFMSLNTNRSMNVNINFVQRSFGIIGNSFGLVTGLGFEFFNYFFENNNSIVVGATGNIESKPYDPIVLDKSKLAITYLTVPLMFEFQFPGALNQKNRLHLAAGVIGGLKLGSHTKVVYYENSKKKKDKDHDDFDINSFKYGLTGRIGYRNISIYGNYYPVSLFEKGKTPELYPYAIGLSFSFKK